MQNSGKFPGVGLVHAPICLLPSPFSDEQFKQAIELAPLFNELIDSISLDHAFLQETLSRFLSQSFVSPYYFCGDHQVIFGIANVLLSLAFTFTQDKKN